MDKPAVEVRAASLAAADYEQRLIELIAVPYDEWATVEVEGRTVAESFAPGAFDRLEAQEDKPRFKVYREHRMAADEDWLGRVIRAEPDDPRGLVLDVKMRRSPEAEQALIDSVDGMYAASVGFSAYPHNQEWSRDRSRRRIIKAYFDHVALTATPAYAGAGILAVRSTVSATPNLDRVLAERAAAGYANPVGS